LRSSYRPILPVRAGHVYVLASGELDHEAAPAAIWRSLDPDAATLTVHEVADHGETEAAPGHAGARLALEANERLEDHVLLATRDAGPLVVYPDPHAVGRARRHSGADEDVLSRRAVLEGVVEQVVQHLTERAAVE